MGVALVYFAVCFKIHTLRYASNQLNMANTQQNDTGS